MKSYHMCREAGHLNPKTQLLWRDKFQIIIEPIAAAIASQSPKGKEEFGGINLVLLTWSNKASTRSRGQFF